VRRLTPELERLAAARPEAIRRTAALIGDDERRALLAAIMVGEPEITRPRPTAPSARPGPGPRAGRRRRKPRLTAGVIAAAGAVAALAAGALTAADVTGAFGSGSSQQIQPAAYMTRVEHALATQAQEGLVGYSRTVLPPGTVIEPTVGAWEMAEAAPGAPSLRPPLTADVMVTWEYQQSLTGDASTATGQPVSAEQITTTGRGLTAVEVSYRDATWWRATRPGTQVPAQPGSPQGDPGSDGLPAYIRQELSSGAYYQDGRQRVDGIDAVKLTGNNGRLVMWINPATYLPVRQVRELTGKQRVQTDFRWFPVTAASLAHLKVSVPVGFRQVQPPPAR
jgi:hypothetical protein